MKELAGRLGLRVQETIPPQQAEDAEQLMGNLFGSWQPEESRDELAEMIYAARQDKPRDTDL